MKEFKKLMIKKSNIMPLIERLSLAYNNTDDEYVVLENSQDSWFILFDEADNPYEAKSKPRCKECKYLDLEDKKSIGYKCNRPGFHRTWESAAWKQKSAAACKAFERKEEDDRD